MAVAFKSTGMSPGLQSRAWRIAGIYAVFATLWIYFSDSALSALISDPSQLVRWSVYKGSVFVALTSLLLLLLMLRAFGEIEAGYRSLREHKREIERFNRLYAALSHINQAIVLSATREALFDTVCEALVIHGGFRMVWVAWCGSDNAPPQASGASGVGTDSIAKVLAHQDSAAEKAVHWQRVMRNGEAVITNDLLKDPTSELLQEEAIRHGLLASAALPVRQHGSVCAVLNVYAGETDFFRDKEIALLEEAAFDVSFALENFALADARREAQSLAQKESLFSQAMIDSMPGILYFYNDQGRFLRWNRNFEVVSGYSAAEIAGMHPLDFFASEDRFSLQQRIADVFAAGQSSIEADFLSRDGTRTPYFFTGRGVEFDGMQCLVGVGIDISERRRAENALRELNETLETRVAERTTELQAAVIRAEAADRIKSAFLATMSHELRTPLNSIIGFTGIVLQQLPGPLNAEQTKQLTMVRGSARHLLELINDVLDLSKIEAGQLEVRAEPFNLETSIERVIATVRLLADNKQLNLTTRVAAPLPEMNSDRRRVEQILLNLLNNAIKFTDHGSITLTVSVAPGMPHGADAEADAVAMVALQVTDTGPGIRPEDMSRLFKPFSQLDTGLARQHEGTGLGLTICRRLANMMGGEITVTSEWGVGSQFTASLPLALPPQAQPGRAAS